MLPAVKRLGPDEGILELGAGTPGYVKFHPGEMISLHQCNQCLSIKPGSARVVSTQGHDLEYCSPPTPRLMLLLLIESISASIACFLFGSLGYFLNLLKPVETY